MTSLGKYLKQLNKRNNMLVKIKVLKEFNVTILQVSADVRYWEDAEVNGESDTGDGDNVPCKVGDSWCPKIEIETGKILNWKQGTTAEVHYKVVDGCGWELHDEHGEVVLEASEGCVPSTLCPKGGGYGDYIKMDIDENGVIANWGFDINNFFEDED